MRFHRIVACACALTLAGPVATAFAGDLGGSRAALRRANRVAKRNDYRFLRTASEVREWVRAERLVTVTSTENYELDEVSFPYTRPAVKLFLDRFAAQYRAATGERLVVTSLTRPLNRQPENASALSVHPAGMAVDLRIPKSAKSRRWIERTLLSLEDRTVLDVTRERHPAHYHVAVFPDEYERYAGRNGR
ncbi:MAG TPA: DUF5715 family protein [Gemmatimonadaceae bacterium]|nr:DUF5715 family protein [Gemmatimonadaceae bacterium]